MEAGIVGLPNVGKSTLFNALTAAGIASENYPFCTIEPNVGVVAVPDARLDAIASFIATEKIVPAPLRLAGIPGLRREKELTPLPLTTREVEALEAQTRKALEGVRVTANPRATRRVRDPQTGNSRFMTEQERQRWT